MTISRRTFIRLAAAGLSSAAVSLTACVEEDAGVATTHFPTPGEPMTPNGDWYFVAMKGAYEADRRNYRLRVGGRVTHARDYRLDELRAELAEAVEPITLACVGGPPSAGLFSASWFRGVRTRDLMDLVGVEGRATSAVIHGLDGYVAMRSLDDLRRQDSLLAYEMGTTPGGTVALPVKNGFPLRVLTPGLYGWVQPKWISSITFLDDSSHFEVIRRSSDTVAGAMQLSSGFSFPRGGSAIAEGSTRVVGYAFGDTRLIDRVEVRVDAGPWQTAEIVWNEADDELPTSVWVLWRFDWEASVGEHDLGVRAFYADGEGQIEGRSFPYSGGSLSTIRVGVLDGSQG